MQFFVRKSVTVKIKSQENKYNAWPAACHSVFFGAVLNMDEENFARLNANIKCSLVINATYGKAALHQ